MRPSQLQLNGPNPLEPWRGVGASLEDDGRRGGTTNRASDTPATSADLPLAMTMVGSAGEGRRSAEAVLGRVRKLSEPALKLHCVVVKPQERARRIFEPPLLL